MISIICSVIIAWFIASLMIGLVACCQHDSKFGKYSMTVLVLTTLFHFCMPIEAIKMYFEDYNDKKRRNR